MVRSCQARRFGRLTVQQREIPLAEAEFSAKIVVAFQAGNSVPEIVSALKIQSTIVYRVLRAAGVMKPGRHDSW